MERRRKTRKIWRRKKRYKKRSWSKGGTEE